MLLGPGVGSKPAPGGCLTVARLENDIPVLPGGPAFLISRQSGRRIVQNFLQALDGKPQIS